LKEDEEKFMKMIAMINKVKEIEDDKTTSSAMQTSSISSFYSLTGNKASNLNAKAYDGFLTFKPASECTSLHHGGGLNST
jgi:hypothetical protein